MVTKRGFAAVPLIVLGTLIATSVILLTSRAAKQKFSYVPRASACYETKFAPSGDADCSLVVSPGNCANNPAYGWVKCGSDKKWYGPCQTEAQCTATSGGGSPAVSPSSPPSGGGGGGGTGDWCCNGTCENTATVRSNFTAVWGANAACRWRYEAETAFNLSHGTCNGCDGSGTGGGGGGGVSPAVSPSSPPSGGGGGGGGGGSCDGGYNWDSASVGCSGGSKLDCICGKLTSGGRPCNSPGTVSGNTICMGNKWDCTWGCTVPKPQPITSPPPKAVTQPPAQPPAGGGGTGVTKRSITVDMKFTGCGTAQLTKISVSSADNLVTGSQVFTPPILGTTFNNSPNNFLPSSIRELSIANSLPGTATKSLVISAEFHKDTGEIYDNLTTSQDVVVSELRSSSTLKLHVEGACTGAGGPAPADDGNWIRCNDLVSYSCDDFCQAAGTTCVANSAGYGSREQETISGVQSSVMYGKCSDTVAPVYKKAFYDYCNNSYNLSCNCKPTSAQPPATTYPTVTVVTITGNLKNTDGHSNLTYSISDPTGLFAGLNTACGTASTAMDVSTPVATDGTIMGIVKVSPRQACDPHVIYGSFQNIENTVRVTVMESGTPIFSEDRKVQFGLPTVGLGNIVLPAVAPTATKIVAGIHIVIRNVQACFNGLTATAGINYLYGPHTGSPGYTVGKGATEFNPLTIDLNAGNGYSKTYIPIADTTPLSTYDYYMCSYIRFGDTKGTIVGLAGLPNQPSDVDNYCVKILQSAIPPQVELKQLIVSSCP